MKNFKAGLKVGAFFLLVFISVPMQYIVFLLPLRQKYKSVLPFLFHKITCRIFGIRIGMQGTCVRGAQTLFLSNHISYLDIVALGSVIPASFIAKKEVDSWPLINILARLQPTAFIERRRTAIKKEGAGITQRLARGESFIIFPEGTSSDGRQVWPFKSSLFALAAGQKLVLQPVTISVLSVDGQSPAAQNIREIYAWHLYMDAPLADHLWAFAKTSGAVLHITFHPALESSAFSDRKELASMCHSVVSSGLIVPDQNECKEFKEKGEYAYAQHL